MQIEQDIYDYLKNHADAAALRALVSRIYWLQVPQSPTWPTLRLSTVNTDPGYLLEGDSTFEVITLEFSIFTDDHAEAVSIREALRALLHGQVIVNGSTDIQSSIMSDTREFWIDDTPGGYLHMPVDFRMIYTNN